MDAVLELADVSKDFVAHKAVDQISLAIPRGSFFSLLGPSGCGKTTTLRLVAGFETPTRGEIRLNGQRIEHLPPYRRNVNTVFQSYAPLMAQIRGERGDDQDVEQQMNAARAIAASFGAA